MAKSDPVGDLPPVEQFFQNPSFSQAQLAPNGKSVAVLIGKKDTPSLLAVYDLKSADVKVIASFRELDINHFQWISDTRLVFDTWDSQSALAETYEGPGLFAVNSDGSGFRQLVSRIQYTERSTGERGERDLLPWYSKLLRTAGRQNSEYVYVIRPMLDSLNWNEVEHVSLLRLNTLTGKAEKVDGPFGAQHWMLDNNGEPRISVTREKNIEIINYLDPVKKIWRKLASFDMYLREGASFSPHAFGADGRLYVEANNGHDKEGLYSFDLDQLKISDKAIFSLEHYDFNGSLITDSNRTLGVRYTSDAEETYWFDSAMSGIQRTVDSKLPNTVNRISIAQRSESPIVLVEAHSDIQPTVYLIFNYETNELNKIGEMYRDISAKEMSHQEMIRYRARDGLEIPAYLTLPRGRAAKNLPMVVLVHGGPFTRGKTWGWNAEAQFLASRGYAVLEPEFRGSTGFGNAHFQSGWKQWGLGMQDDIADGALWAIKQAYVDPKRICIAGASYGGYASLMGLINNPELFRCGFEWVGVTDINMMFEGYKGHDSDLPAIWKSYGMPLLIGDPIEDAAQLKATSPLQQEARITQPLLMAYGGADRRVPMFHGKVLYDKLKMHNPNVEWIFYSKEGHGWKLVKTNVDFWSRVEKFLQKNLGE